MSKIRGTLTIDMQYGSTGKGLYNGYLANKNHPDHVFTANGPNSGHVYISEAGQVVKLMQLPNGIISPGLKRVMIGPGAIINLDTLLGEIEEYRSFLIGSEIIIHENAAIVTQDSLDAEKYSHLSDIGSTQTGTGAAVISKIDRNPLTACIARYTKDYLTDAALVPVLVVTPQQWVDILGDVKSFQIEGAQGFSLSINHGFWPYTTSRDCSPAQIMADCGIPIDWYINTEIHGTLRTYPIRVNNKTGSSGPCYPDQKEITFESIGQVTELTTTTKLPRRIFTFSHRQLKDAYTICHPDNVFINFMNYIPQRSSREFFISQVQDTLCDIDGVRSFLPSFMYGYGPKVSDIKLNLV